MPIIRNDILAVYTNRPEDLIIEPGEIDNLLAAMMLRAFFDARAGKRRTRDEHIFEVNALDNIMNLCHDVLMRQYHPSPGTAFIVDDPTIREIFAAPFRDRVIHHLLYNLNADWWDRRMCYDSSSCRIGKGTLFATRRLERHIQSITDNYSKEAYAIGLDIKGYFMSLPRKGLFERVCWGLERQFPNKGVFYEICRFLWKEIIFDDPTIGVTRRGSRKDWDKLPISKTLFGQEPGRGIVIGNLSSQLLSNIYLDVLDQFIVGELGYKHYGRYVDDFFILVTPEQLPQALRDINAIAAKLDECGLELHPRKRRVQPVSHGVPFVGSVCYPGRTVPGRRLKENFYEAAYLYSHDIAPKEKVISYLGHVKHINGQMLAKRVFDANGWDFNFFGGSRGNN